jgi:formamidopyrimidine-DNA glycosylase
MPELPEVEWIAQRLHRWAINQPILGVTTNNYAQYLPNVGSVLDGQVIRSIYRRGKYLLIQVDRGILVGHNSMSGFWDTKEDPTTFDYVEGARAPTDKDVHVQIQLPNCTLRYHDARRFGFLKYYPRSEQASITDPLQEHRTDPHIATLYSLGPEPIRTMHNAPFPVWNALSALDAISASKQSIKNYLMDQSQVAGVGNIYATEALWRAQVHPRKISDQLSDSQITCLYGTLQSILNTSIQLNLNYTKFLQVYRQPKCLHCQGKIERIQIGGRSTYFCPHCQVV